LTIDDQVGLWHVHNEEMYNPIAVFVTVGIVLTGAWFGFWGVSYMDGLLVLRTTMLQVLLENIFVKVKVIRPL